MINWKLRFKNKATLTAFVVTVVALVYQILGLCGVTPAVSQNDVVNVVGVVINLLAMMGVVVDPTTEGVADSELAQGYDEPSPKTKLA